MDLGEEEALGAHELPGAAWERTPKRSGVGFQGRGIRGSGAPGEFGVGKKTRREEFLPEQTQLTILVKAQERGTGIPKSTVPESRRKPEGRTISQAEEYPQSQVHGHLPEPRFQEYKGETVPLDFQTWGRMADSVGAPNSGFGGMAVRSGLGGAPSAGFWGLGQSRIQVLGVMKERASLGAPPCSRHCRVKVRDKGSSGVPAPQSQI